MCMLVFCLDLGEGGSVQSVWRIVCKSSEISQNLSKIEEKFLQKPDFSKKGGPGADRVREHIKF